MYMKSGAKLGNEPKEPINSLKNQIVAMSRSLAKTQSQMNLEQKKLMVMLLTKIRWSCGDNSNVLTLNKLEVLDALELQNEKTGYVRKALEKMVGNSMVRWTDPDDAEHWRSDMLFTGVTSEKGTVSVTVNPYYMPLLENLVHNTPYITIWSNDVYSFNSRFAFALFEDLRLHWDDRYRINYRSYTTKQLKEIFGLDKADYVRKDGSFDRYQFEKKTIDRAISEINETEMIRIMPTSEDRKGRVQFYKKLKEFGEIKGYQIAYICRTRTDSPEKQNSQGESREGR